MAHDDEFLEHTLQNALQVDEFTANLYDIWVKVRQEGIAQVNYLIIILLLRRFFTLCPINMSGYSEKKIQIERITSFLKSI